MREATHRSDVLLSNIGVGGSIVLSTMTLGLTDTVDLLVHLSSVEVALLTSTGNSPGHTGRMPGTDTSDLSVTSVGLLLKMAGSPSGHHTLESVSFGDTDHIEALIVTEDLVNSDFLLEERVSKLSLGRNVLATIDLNLKDVVLFLAKVLHKVVLSVHNCAH